MGSALGLERRKPESIDEKDNIERRVVIDELLHTEELYVDALRTVVNEFLGPLSRRRSLLKSKYIPIIFSNVEKLYQLHQSFFETLQAECSANPSCRIGALMLSAVRHLLPCRKRSTNHHMKVEQLGEYSKYLNNYENAQKALQKVSQKSLPLHRFLESKEKSLPNLLVYPIGVSIHLH